MAKKLKLGPNKWAIKPLKLLPHEWVFNGFLLLTFLRLVFSGAIGALPTVAFFTFILAGIGLVIWTQDRPTPLRWRIRLLWYPSVMGMSFYLIPAAVAAMKLATVDSLLAPLDEKLLGIPAADYFLLLQSPVFTDIMCAGYVFFFIYVIVGPGYYCIYDMRLFRSCITGMFTIWGLGFVGYTFMPAGGPYQAVYFPGALPEGWLAQHVLGFINGASNGVDVFPSIHAAVSLYLLVFDRLNYRARYELFMLPVLLLWLSTIYLRYHYFVDLIAGALLAGIGLAVVWLYQRSAMTRTLEEEALYAKLRGK